jgi:hypothetical protein
MARGLAIILIGATRFARCAGNENLAAAFKPRPVDSGEQDLFGAWTRPFAVNGKIVSP